jgi:hypothetical protein
MPFREIPDTRTRYALISFDNKGREVRNDPDGQGGRMSEELLKRVQQKPPDSIFLFIHGWKGDMPAAVDQYNRWIKAVLDRSPAGAAPSGGEETLYIGLHWPSLPWGDDELGPAGDFAAGAGVGLAQLKQRYVDRLGDDAAIRAALDIIFEEARVNAAALSLAPEVAQAYHDLNQALDLGEAGVGAGPGDDREPFDPERSFQLAQAESGAAGFGGFDLGGVLSPLRQLSFWTMKKRARSVGESGMHQFVADLQRAGRAHLHLMGHSFGCIVASSILGGPGGRGALPRPVESAVLVQGALSLWAYAPDIPKAPGRPGYFHRLIERGAVRGPIVTTQSRFDRAVGTFYPLAAGVAGELDFGPTATDLPSYGGIGAFGICGVAGVENKKLLKESEPYGFRAGAVYNLDGSEFIRKGGGASGAHSDIDGPQVANAIQQAARAGAGAMAGGGGE